MQIIQVPATAADDPDGIRSAAILNAHLHLEQIQIFCRLLWRRLVALSIGWTLFAGLVPGLSRAALEVGLGIFSAAGVGAFVLERRTARSLDRLIGVLPHAVRAAASSHPPQLHP